MWVCDGALPDGEPCLALWAARMHTCPTCETVGPLRAFGTLPKDARHPHAQRIPFAKVPRAPKACDRCEQVKELTEYDVDPHTLRHGATCRACVIASLDPPPVYASKAKWVAWAEAAGHALTGDETKDDLVELAHPVPEPA